MRLWARTEHRQEQDKSELQAWARTEHQQEQDKNEAMGKNRTPVQAQDKNELQARWQFKKATKTLQARIT